MSGHRVDRTRRSAKGTVTEMAESMLKRTNGEHVNVKLDVLQTIAARMSWNDLFEKLKNRFRYQQAAPIQSPDDDRSEKWWQK